MQVYAGVETLTNQPSAAERAEVPHHLVGYLPLTESSSVGAHAPLAHAAIDAAAERGALPLVVGGTGLYLRAALAELELPPAVAAAERARWERFYDERGGARRAGRARSDATRAPPVACTPTTAAASCARSSSSEQGASLAPERDRLWGSGMRRPALVAVLSWPRAELRARIAARTEAMLAGGALDEVRALRESGVEPSPTAGAHPRARADRRSPRRRATLAEVAAEITLRTGQYARRQETWARRIPEVHRARRRRRPGAQRRPPAGADSLTSDPEALARLAFELVAVPSVTGEEAALADLRRGALPRAARRRGRAPRQRARRARGGARGRGRAGRPSRHRAALGGPRAGARGHARDRPRRRRHEGRRRGHPRGARGLRAHARRRRLRVLRPRGGAEPRERHPRGARRFAAARPAGLRVRRRADGLRHPRGLRRRAQRRSRLPRPHRAQRTAVGGRERRPASAVPFLERAARHGAAARRGRGPDVPRHALHHADPGRHRAQRRPGSRSRSRSTCASRPGREAADARAPRSRSWSRARAS